MIDGFSTTFDWQRHTGRIAVWGIGSFEQHSHHLPLNTDGQGAAYFSRMAAEELDAALLPALPYGNCLEHSGFRGSITLSPETLMAIVRDFAAALEEQGFQRLVVISGHGGNHSLVPVIRDINRRNRPLKILLVNWWEFADMGPLETGHTEVHAGEFETSIMLAIDPAHVGAERVDVAPPGERPLRAQDLTTFGTGHLAPDGAMGHPSLASREKGEKLIASVRAGMMAHIRDRLRRLDEQPRYSGAGGMAMRPLVAGDLSGCMRLSNTAGWNQTERDWSSFLAANPDTCFGMLHNGALVGTSAGIAFGRAVAWIGMMLVDPAFRRMGIATRLMRQTMDSLAACASIKLDATPAGRPVYEKLGFVAEYDLKRMVCRAVPHIEVPEGSIGPVTEADVDHVAGFDADAFGAERAGVLRHLVSLAPELAWQIDRDGVTRALCLGRPGTNYTQVGPVAGESLDEALTVLSAALADLQGRPAVIDVPDHHPELIEWLHMLGFVAQRPFTRMYYRANVAGTTEKYFAIAGPELG